MPEKQDGMFRKTLLTPIFTLVVNQSVYYGGNWIAANKNHYCFELPVDKLVPFLPWTVSIYFGCYLFWAAIYIIMAYQERSYARRFFLADLITKAVCFLCFVFLPTTNTRPPVNGNGLWMQMMALLYRLDAPTNLFPSIHCLVSWLCFIGVRENDRFPYWSRVLTGATALAVCISTLTTRQHVMVDVWGGILLAELGWRLTGNQLKAFFGSFFLEKKNLGGLGGKSPPRS